ncbi:P-loop containing nucleoside triphosphate hydrolase protein [Epithele typhae]|uniref:P-loop containing nucleoside triphosphate hydrolase protein n=1 Tax=Epithele typhae TaxID=378194 RepID=UPI002007C86A|nr:P-loop containing nucleoside triphosphate hydrolase protein [Epithele typhae]KAH9925422.1 P-loop containing nucleoside triphosphate hydrolase protein [Epithele typhae]
MVKRRTIEDEQRYVGGEPAYKRPRTDGKGKERAAGGHDSDMDEDDEEVAQLQEPNEDEEKKFEEEHEERIRERLMNKSKAQGGHNGSGKSAALSALTVALGGKATSTGRGSGLKSFIREGQSVAEVTVVLKNQGEEAYQPDKYGSSIFITRRFTKDGSSSYKLRGKDGKTISQKREDLQAICDHMNIQVDNPMNILTQDSARQFLASATPADKYKFFLKGTQLSQLSEEYQTCMENISQTAKILKRKAEVLPGLEDSYEEARTRYEEAKKAREQRHKADELKKELAWAHVATKEAELQKQLVEVEKAKHKAAKQQESLTAAQAKLEAIEEEVIEKEREMEEYGTAEQLEDQKREATKKRRELQAQLSQFSTSENQIQQSKSGLDKQIKGYELEIAQEQKRVESHSRGKRDHVNAQLTETNALLAAKQAEEQTLQQEHKTCIQEADAAKQECDRLQQDVARLQQKITECDYHINKARELEKDKLSVYGKNMEAVVGHIKTLRWHGQPPIGPFGKYVKVKDPQKWGPILAVTIGAHMSSFAITDARDRPALAEVLTKSGNRHCQIIISAQDMFDYSRGEPPPEYLTILRAIEVTEPNTGRPWNAITSDHFRVARTPPSDGQREGGAHSTTIPTLNRNHPRTMLFRATNAQTDVARTTEELSRANAELVDVNSRVQQQRRKYDELRGRAQRIDNQMTGLKKTIRTYKSTLTTLQEELNEDLPVNIQTLQDAISQAQQERQNVLDQYAQLAREKAQVEGKIAPINQELDEIRQRLARHNDGLDVLRKKVSDAAVARMEVEKGVGHWKEKIALAGANVADAEKLADVHQVEFEQWTKKALEYCERVENPRMPDVVQRNLQAVQAALKEREKRQGATVEEIAEEMTRKKNAFDVAMKELKGLMQLNKALKKSVKVRLARWHEFRRHIALRCKVYFGYHLSNRGYFGKVLFDHVAGTLDIRVNTDDQALTQQSTREKDAKSLSGGEKSFSTICLLLSLWESIGCPIRCLDEFDVYMDAANRRVTMKMMIDMANTSNRKQYILITPQDMSHISFGNSVRVHRMSDPERGQGTLAFGGS